MEYLIVGFTLALFFGIIFNEWKIETFTAITLAYPVVILITIVIFINSKLEKDEWK